MIFSENSDYAIGDHDFDRHTGLWYALKSMLTWNLNVLERFPRRAGLVTLLPVALPRNRGAHRWLIAIRTAPDNVVAFFSPIILLRNNVAFEVRSTYLSECIVGAMAKYKVRDAQTRIIFYSFRRTFPAMSVQFSLSFLIPSISFFYI